MTGLSWFHPIKFSLVSEGGGEYKNLILLYSFRLVKRKQVRRIALLNMNFA